MALEEWSESLAVPRARVSRLGRARNEAFVRCQTEPVGTPRSWRRRRRAVPCDGRGHRREAYEELLGPGVPGEGPRCTASRQMRHTRATIQGHAGRLRAVPSG